MPSIKHSVPDDLKTVSLEELLPKRVARFDEIEPDWDAFAIRRSKAAAGRSIA